MKLGVRLALLVFGTLVLVQAVVGGTRRGKEHHHTKKHHRGRHISTADYYISKDLRDGERLTWVALGGILAKERRTTHENVHWTVIARTVSNGKSVVISIIDGTGTLADCDVQTSSESTSKFTNEFEMAVQELSNTKRPTVIHKKNIPGFVDELANFEVQYRRCFRFHEKLESHAKRKTNGGGRRRSKRSPDALMYPGTNWCGRGNRAKNYTHLGVNLDTDRCCRAHDHCPYTITSFETKFGIPNIRFGTLSHCECDFDFRSCLKDVDTEVGHMVGNIFFNIYQTQCFTFEPKKICKKRSWWGNCDDHIYEIQGVLRDPVEY
ncbi:uncharacterized protein LOC141899340 [Tubulanus polymorphus]|uniref:uncharacterized protein LOC141899340 n=1 Tax=Tubulanus polymorphus TaxID=672921 RepID=UPI003DA3E951